MNRTHNCETVIYELLSLCCTKIRIATITLYSYKITRCRTLSLLIMQLFNIYDLCTFTEFFYSVIIHSRSLIACRCARGLRSTREVAYDKLRWIFPCRVQPIVKQYRRRCRSVFMPDSRTVPIPVIGECLELKYADMNTSICLLCLDRRRERTLVLPSKRRPCACFPPVC